MAWGIFTILICWGLFYEHTLYSVTHKIRGPHSKKIKLDYFCPKNESSYQIGPFMWGVRDRISPKHISISTAGIDIYAQGWYWCGQTLVYAVPIHLGIAAYGQTFVFAVPIHLGIAVYSQTLVFAIPIHMGIKKNRVIFLDRYI